MDGMTTSALAAEIAVRSMADLDGGSVPDKAYAIEVAEACGATAEAGVSALAYLKRWSTERTAARKADKAGEATAAQHEQVRAAILKACIEHDIDPQAVLKARLRTHLAGLIEDFALFLDDPHK